MTELRPMVFFPRLDLWWQDYARCKGQPEPFFPPVPALAGHLGARAEVEREREAIAICRQCPVKLLCLDHALALPEPHGVWGGKTEEERLRIRRKMLVA